MMLRLRRLIFLVFLIGSSSCVSVSSQVDREIQTKNFENAYRILKKYDVEKSDTELEQDLVDLKSRYTKEVELESVRVLDKYLADYEIDDAEIAIDRFQNLCPWSVEINRQRQKLDEIVENIAAFVGESKDRYTTQGMNEAAQFVFENRRKYLCAIKSVRFSNKMISSVEAIISGLALDYSARRSSEVVIRIGEKLHFDDETIEQIIEISTPTQRPFGETNITADPALLASISRQLKMNVVTNDGISIEPLSSALQLEYVRALEGAISDSCKSLSAINQIEFYENWVYLLPEIRPYLAEKIASMHTSVVVNNKFYGFDLIQPIVHLRRAVMLLDEPAASLSSTVSLLKETDIEFSKVVPIALDVVFDADPEIDPPVQAVMQLLLLGELKELIREFVDIRALDYKSVGDLKLFISSASWVIPNEEQLSKVDSLFFSHTESVPNPIRNSLEFQISMAKVSIDSAESYLDSVIFSHNLNPTEWSLLSVNIARNRYLSSVNRHNALVAQFNSAPITITSPVNLPYQFSEGLLSQEVACALDCEFGDEVLSDYSHEVESCFVRRGTKLSDTNSDRRRDVSCDSDFGVDPFFDMISNSLSNVLLGEIRFSLAAAIRSKLTGVPELYHSALLSLLLNCDVEEFNSIPNWQDEALTGYELPKLERGSQEVQIAKPSILEVTDYGSTSEYYSTIGHSICQVVSPNGFGTGFLLSTEGIVATSAHVVSGLQHHVKFNFDDSTHEFSAEVISKDDSTDLALLKLADFDLIHLTPLQLSRDNYFPIGAELFIFGYPNLGEFKGDFGAPVFVEGKLSKSAHLMSGSSFHVIDATISSGSSGGPIILKSTGEVVGVVHAILNPEFSNTFSSSGARVLASQSSFFFDVLNLKYP